MGFNIDLAGFYLNTLIQNSATRRAVNQVAGRSDRLEVARCQLLSAQSAASFIDTCNSNPSFGFPHLLIMILDLRRDTLQYRLSLLDKAFIGFLEF